MVLEVAKQESEMTVILSLSGVMEPPRLDVSSSQDIINNTARLQMAVLIFIGQKCMSDFVVEFVNGFRFGTSGTFKDLNAFFLGVCGQNRVNTCTVADYSV